MDRIVVVGSSGSGKAFLAQRSSSILDSPNLELDSVFHRDGWGNTPDDRSQQEIETLARAKRWVVDGNYTSHGTREVLRPLADTCRLVRLTQTDCDATGDHEDPQAMVREELGTE